MNPEIEKIQSEVQSSHSYIQAAIEEAQKVMIGQSAIVERMLMGLLLQGHILIEGVPGLAKTTLVRTLAKVMGVGFQRIQFTPDLLPADLLGTQIYNPKTQEFTVKKGPIFSNVILADEINRAPAKVQSALLEAMQEKQVTIGEQSFPLTFPFVVLATQNPIEQEGTYPLPEAQMDRFMFKLHIGYPKENEEVLIMDRALNMDKNFSAVQSVLNQETLRKMSEVIGKIYVDPKIKEYIVRIVFATREPERLKVGLEKHLQFGASPRASIFLYQAAMAYAFMQGRAFVTPQDLKEIGPDVLRHRIILNYEAEAEGLSTDDILKTIFDHVEVP